MRRYLIAYAAWLTFVIAASAVALAWYKHVEQIGVRELGEKLAETGNSSDESNA